VVWNLSVVFCCHDNPQRVPVSDLPFICIIFVNKSERDTNTGETADETMGQGSSIYELLEKYSNIDSIYLVETLIFLYSQVSSMCRFSKQG